ncbi:bifunctional phosphoglucose/phosphomannose isomerase [SAR202 cluster bacterium AD-804-J14_MRT_500m]|nr:bifunctional phosphoglucose/phosphomannose isomerase [SAR202 cluster bacterium AD-804-J14_MRT_500m]
MVTPVSILDDSEFRSKIDPSGLIERLQKFPEHCRQAWELSHKIDLPPEYSKAKNVVISGMGGSAIGGDLLSDLAALEPTLPIEIHRTYDLPAYADESSLIIATSYSGNTAETLSGFRRAIERNTMLVVITSGGILAQEAVTANIPTFSFDFTGEPRSALGYSLIGPLGIMVRLGLISDKKPDLDDALESLTCQISQSIGHDVPAESNPAKALALSLENKLPVIYGGGFFEGVARRWKTQFNENSKVWAQWEILPEAHHNAVSGLKLPKALRDLATVILLRPEPIHPSIAWRYEITEELLESVDISFCDVAGAGNNPLSQILSTVLLGDYTSYYLALLQGIDPSPVSAIESIKQRLSE